MKLQEYFTETRQYLTEMIHGVFTEEAGKAAPMAGTSSEIFLQLERYACSGKMLRGILGRLGADLFTWNNSMAEMSSGQARLGTALELFQAGLLAHDDIMDQDDQRRGKPTLHKAFESAERELSARGKLPDFPNSIRTSGRKPDFRRLGESQGICAGDIFFFEAWKLLTATEQGDASSLSARFSRELVDVCLAQMADVRFGSLDSFPSLEEVLEVYAYKTARYTITLPLCAGAVLAGRPDAVPALEAIGAPMGMAFQLRDDYLGLFGDEMELGKPIGSDLREGKKTPLMISLVPRLSQAEKASFLDIFGKEGLDENGIEDIRGLVMKYGVDAEIRALIDVQAAKTREALESFSQSIAGYSVEAFSLLKDFIDYSISRKS